jgi:hypothetical protein
MLGGIMINCDGEKTDKFLPLKFELRHGSENIDVFEQTFGFKSIRMFGKDNILEKLKFLFVKKEKELENN